jgi:hypothetical protein
MIKFTALDFEFEFDTSESNNVNHLKFLRKLSR